MPAVRNTAALRAFWRLHRWVLLVTGRYYVVASFAGEDRDPDWALNLRATPKATVTLGGRTISVRARALSGDERESIFARFVDSDGAYGEYRDRTDREIPVFELTPEG